MKHPSLFRRASLSLTFISLGLVQAPAAFCANQSLVQEEIPQKKDIGVVSKDEKDVCPTTVEQGEIIGITHAVHEGIFGLRHIPYHRSYTVFSVALGKQVFTTRYPGIVHKRDFVGVVTVSECREPTAAVIPIGPLKSNK